MFGSRLTEHRATRVLAGAAIGTTVVTLAMTSMAAPASAETSSTVTLTIDGTTTEVTTSASTVGELLTEQAVPADNTDIVTPGPVTALSTGMAVTWTPAVRVYVRQDGTRTPHRVTSVRASRVAAELGLPTGTADFSKTKAYSFKQTRLYGPAGRWLTGDDRVLENSIAVVHRIGFTFPDDRVRIKNNVVRDKSKLVRDGSTRVFQKGHDGSKKLTYRKRWMDGKLVNSRVVKSQVVRQAQRRIVRVGTGPNWVGLARCESSGNPNAVNPAGFYGLYQFSVSTWRSVVGKGLPTDYGYWEQTKRAWILFQASGRSPWPVCGRYL
jgi:uncharacterized protein YabE (DUF348 family)